MNTATPRVLSGPDVRALSKRSDARGAWQTALHGAAVAGAGWWVAVAGPWTILPAIVLLGVTQAALFAPMHETVHLTAFASRRANAVVGWLAACPSLMNWHFYGAFHAAHHRFTQDPARDPELRSLPPAQLDTYLMRVLSINYWRTRAQVTAACWCGDLSRFSYLPPASHRRIIASVRWMCVALAAGTIAAALWFGWWTPLVFWVLPQLIGQVFLRLYLLTEHAGCAYSANGLINTRTTLTNALTRWLMWNMSYHAEHHLYPSIPFYRLPDAHCAVRSRLAVVQDSYRTWHVQFLRSILNGRTAGSSIATRG